MTPEGLAMLATELGADPAGLGLTAMSDEAAAWALNAPGRPVARITMTGAEILEALNPTELRALTAAQLNFVLLVTGAGGAVAIGPNSVARAILMALFGAGTASRAKLAAASVQTGSRAEELGLGLVTPSDVADARRLIG